MPEVKTLKSDSSETIKFNLKEPRKLTAKEKEKIKILLMNIDRQLAEDKRLGVYPKIPELYKKAPEKMNYKEYRRLLLTPWRIRKGIGFYKKHKTALKEVNEKYGIDPSVISSIIGLESSYGRIIGKFSAANVFITHMLLFKGKKREYGLEQMKSLLKFCEKNNLDPFELPSSYAGAVGYGQFIPSSLINYYIDGNGDGIADPYSIIDTIHSIANFLKKNGWNNDRRKAIYAYNNSDNYVKLIFELADEIRKGR